MKPRPVRDEGARVFDERAFLDEENAVLVNTAEVLTIDDWTNELHPTPNGFKKVAKAFIDAFARAPELLGRVDPVDA